VEGENSLVAEMKQLHALIPPSPFPPPPQGEREMIDIAIRYEIAVMDSRGEEGNIVAYL